MAAPSQSVAINGTDGSGTAFTPGATMYSVATISSAKRVRVHVKIPAAAVASDIFALEIWVKDSSGDTSTKVGQTVSVSGIGAALNVNLGDWPAVTELIVKAGQPAGSGRTITGSITDIG